MRGSVGRGAGAIGLAVCVAGSTAGCAAMVEHSPPARRPPAARMAGAGTQARFTHSVVRVRGFASSRGRRTETTGFVYAPERVLLDAHASAGVDRDLEVVLDDGRRFPARVVAPVSRQIHRFQGAAVEPGMAGAPLVTGGDRAMGMVFAVNMDRADVGYALTAAQIEAGENGTTAVPHEPCS